LKNGGPTVIFTPRTASDSTGKIVPHSVENAIPTSSRLLNRKADSRDSMLSSLWRGRRDSRRQISSAEDPASTKHRKPMKKGPIPDCVNECTDEITPERVRNVPKMVRPKVTMMRVMFQTFSMSLRSWIITE
jgi:hypothetical protein